VQEWREDLIAKDCQGQHEAGTDQHVQETGSGARTELGVGHLGKVHLGFLFMVLRNTTRRAGSG
jgi:hypothetical protein